MAAGPWGQGDAMKARVARKVLARFAFEGDASTYRTATTRRALARWQRAAGMGSPTRDRFAWRWAWQLRAAARQVGVQGRRAWLALHAQLAARVREHKAGGRPLPALARAEARAAARAAVSS